MTEHILKCEQPYFDAVASGEKPFEVRVNDRSFQRGDTLRLREYHCDQGTCDSWHPGFPYDSGCRYTGREVTCLVTYVLSATPMVPLGDLVVMGIKLVDPEEH